MSSQLIFFEKNKADFEQSFVTVTASEGQANGRNMLDRNNFSAWVTTDSTDASGTNFVVDMIDPREIDNLLFIKHNWKAFTVKYWDGISAFVDFATPIAETVNADDTTRFQVTKVTTSKIQVVITATQTADDEKFLFQFIATMLLGKLDGWPRIVSPTFDRNLVNNEMISGKEHFVENTGKYRARLTVDNWKLAADLTIVERLYEEQQGFLFWPSGGDETQFSSIRKGYRLEDIFLVRPKRDHMPEWRKGNYFTGMKINIELVEVIT